MISEIWEVTSWIDSQTLNGWEMSSFRQELSYKYYEFSVGHFW